MGRWSPTSCRWRVASWRLPSGQGLGKGQSRNARALPARKHTHTHTCPNTHLVGTVRGLQQILAVPAGRICSCQPRRSFPTLKSITNARSTLSQQAPPPNKRLAARAGLPMSYEYSV